MRIRMVVCLVWLGLAPTPSPAQDKKEPLEKRVERSIKKGVQFLRDQQQKDGGWEVDIPAAVHKGGWTSLALLALLKAGVSPKDRTVADGLANMRKKNPNSVYVCALQIMAFAEAGQAEDKKRIEKNIAWLIKARVMVDGEFKGWSYSDKEHSTDNSNTHYAVLGLWAAHKAGVPVDMDVWRDVREHYVRTQIRDDQWPVISTSFALIFLSKK